MFSQEQVDRFWERGFVTSDRLISDAEVESLQLEMEKVLEGKSEKAPVLNRDLNVSDGKATVYQIVNIWEASEAFWKLASNPTITEMAAQLMKTDTVRIWHDQIQYKPAKIGGAASWHQDHPAWPIIQPPDLVSCWLALDDATLENGCMHMVPGSHEWGDQSKNMSMEDDFTLLWDKESLPEGAVVEIEPVPVKAGHALFHHCLNWHGSPPNRSERPRRAIAIHYMPGHVRYDPIGTHVMEAFVTVEKGEILSGDSFPLVREKGEPVTSL